MNTETPCIGMCSTSFGDEVCIGCGRTFEEVYSWNSMTKEEKDKINKRLLKDSSKERK